MNWKLIGSTEMIPVREGKKVTLDKVEFAVFNTGDDFFAIGNRCPHKSGPLADGIICGKTVTCPLHNYNISLENGCAIGEKGKVKVYPTKVEDGKVYVAPDNGKFASTT